MSKVIHNYHYHNYDDNDGHGERATTITTTVEPFSYGQLVGKKKSREGDQ